MNSRNGIAQSLLASPHIAVRAILLFLATFLIAQQQQQQHGSLPSAAAVASSTSATSSSFAIPTPGVLSFIGTFGDGSSIPIRTIKLTPDNKFLLTVGSSVVEDCPLFRLCTYTYYHSIYAFNVNATSGSLSNSTSSQPVEGTKGWDLAIAPDSTSVIMPYVYESSTSSSLNVYNCRLNTSSSTAPVSGCTPMTNVADSSVASANSKFFVAVSPATGDRVFVLAPTTPSSTTKSGTIYVLNRTPSTGGLANPGVKSPSDIESFKGVSSFVVTDTSADANVSNPIVNVYAVSPASSSLTRFSYYETGVSTNFARLNAITNATVPQLTGARSIAITADNRHLYVAAADGTVTGGALLVFNRSASEEGNVMFVEAYTSSSIDALQRASAVSVSRDGRFVFVATSAGKVATFKRNPATGQLQFVSAIAASGSPDFYSMAVSSDAKLLYVSNQSTGTTTKIHAFAVQDCILNSTSCVHGGTPNYFDCFCVCSGPWTGDFCQICSRTNDSCLNGGTLNEETCECQDCSPHWIGPTCETCNITCENGGTVVASNCTCSCSSGWNGTFCEEGIPPEEFASSSSSSSSRWESSQIHHSAPPAEEESSMAPFSPSTATTSTSSTSSSSSSSIYHSDSSRKGIKASSSSSPYVSSSSSSSSPYFAAVGAAGPLSQTAIIAIAVGAGVVACLLVALVMIAILVVAVTIRRKNNNNRDKCNSVVTESSTKSAPSETAGTSVAERAGSQRQVELVSTNSVTTIDINTATFEISSEQLKIVKKVGQGAFGVVYLANYHNDMVAVKKFNLEVFADDHEGLEKFLREFEKEVRILAEYRHENILNFVGATTQYPHLAIVTEFCEMGSLYDFIHKRRPASSSAKTLDWMKKLTILLEIALGVDFLHRKGLIHRDLKSQNILLNNKLTAKVADFGLSKIKTSFDEASKQTAEEMTQMVGTPLWMAPEVISANYGKECDVYSYGMIIYELLMEKLPFYEETLKAHIHYKVAKDENFRPSVADLSTLTSDLEGLDIPAEALLDSKERVAAIMRQCWQGRPEARPPLREVIASIRVIQSNLNSAKASM